MLRLVGAISWQWFLCLYYCSSHSVFCCNCPLFIILTKYQNSSANADELVSFYLIPSNQCLNFTGQIANILYEKFIIFLSHPPFYRYCCHNKYNFCENILVFSIMLKNISKYLCCSMVKSLQKAFFQNYYERQCLIDYRKSFQNALDVEFIFTPDVTVMCFLIIH